MDRKVVLTAAIVVAFLLSSSILVTFYNPVEEDKEIRLIGRVNTEGSGIYLAPGESRDTYVTPNTAWLPMVKPPWMAKATRSASTWRRGKPLRQVML